MPKEQEGKRTNHDVQGDEATCFGDGFANVVSFTEGETASDGCAGACGEGLSVCVPVCGFRRA